MSLREGPPVDPRLPWVRTLQSLSAARSVSGTGPREHAVERAGRTLGDALRSGPRVVSVRTLPTSAAPYPIRFAFNGALQTLGPTQMLVIQNRSLLIQVKTEEGLKNVLWNPTDGPANAATPFYQRVVANTPKSLSRFFLPKPNRCREQLAELGLSPADIDVIAFDHFHTQDIRPLLGTDGLAARFPNALLLAPKVEWEDWDALPMIQRAWFVRDGKRGVPKSRVVLTAADLSLGDGLLLLRTPGHTSGNQTLFVHAGDGVFGSSENGTAADNWAPHHSRLGGVRRAAKLLDVEVILNSNTPELAAEQYTSMLLERAVVDRVPGKPEFFQMFPSSEVTASVIAPGIAPTHSFFEATYGEVAARTTAPTAERSAYA